MMKLVVTANPNDPKKTKQFTVDNGSVVAFEYNIDFYRDRLQVNFSFDAANKPIEAIARGTKSLEGTKIEVYDNDVLVFVGIGSFEKLLIGSAPDELRQEGKYVRKNITFLITENLT